MKYILLASLIILGIILYANTRDNTSAGDSGIRFFEGSWEEALKQSAKENKPIFLDIYASWCGPCKMLKKNTFTNEAVGDYFNQHFINVAADGEKGEGVMLAKKYNIRAYPSLLFVDQKGDMIQYKVGFQSPQQLLNYGTSVTGK